MFLFDEPLSNLDAKLRTEMRLEIKRLHDELRKTIVYVTHDQIEAMTMATKIAVMDTRRHPAGRHAGRDLRAAGQPVRRALHRLAGDEHPRRPIARATADAGGATRPTGVADRPLRLRLRAAAGAGDAASPSASGPSISPLGPTADGGGRASSCRSATASGPGATRPPSSPPATSCSRCASTTRSCRAEAGQTPSRALPEATSSTSSTPGPDGGSERRSTTGEERKMLTRTIARRSAALALAACRRARGRPDDVPHLVERERDRGAQRLHRAR